jgi:hypothetical protein
MSELSLNQWHKTKIGCSFVELQTRKNAYYLLIVLKNMEASLSKRQRILETIREVSEMLDYPVTKLDDLDAKIGDDFEISATSLPPVHLKFRDVKQDIPKDFFPIKDKTEFIEKATRLYNSKREPDASDEEKEKTRRISEERDRLSKSSDSHDRSQ